MGLRNLKTNNEMNLYYLVNYSIGKNTGRNMIQKKYKKEIGLLFPSTKRKVLPRK